MKNLLRIKQHYQVTLSALWALLAVCVLASAAAAQNTAFTYQGKLTDAGNPANGNYDLQFKLFDTVTVGTGTQQGAPVTVSNVLVAAGIFTVQLDFGAGVFPGAQRFLEIGVKPISGGTFTVLGPRQPITSTPYAIKSVNAAAADSLSAACAGCVTGAQIGSLPTNSGSYIQNTTTAQASSNFYISGSGTVGDSLGVGTTPNPGFKLDMIGNARITTANGAVIQFASPNAESGMTTTFNGGRADLRFDGASVKLVAGLAGGPPSATNGIIINTDGIVGIGTSNPLSQLDVDGGDNDAVRASSKFGFAVHGRSTASSGIAVFGENLAGGYAGRFDGKVVVNGVLEKPGGGFKIDHPLDPENKYLVHSFVESPDMKNLYDGTVTTDANGEAEITLPDWFATLNRDFRYQLTCIGVFAQAIIAEEIKDNRFKIRTSLPQVKVSWQVTGIRQDAWANQNRLPVEEPKPAVERGSYQNPTAFGQPEERSIEWARNPARMKQQKEQRERWQREQNNKDTAPAARPNNR